MAISLLARGRQGAKMMTGPPTLRQDPSIECAPVDAHVQFSADGSVFAVVEKTGVRVLQSDGGQTIFSQPRPQVQAIHLSPKGTFLVTWEKLVDGAEEGNLKVWHVASGSVTAHFKQKVLGDKSQWPAVKWSSDEAIAYRLVTNEVHFFDGQKPTLVPEHRLRIEGIAQCSIMPGAGPEYSVATFVAEKKSAPAQMRLWRHGDYGEGRFLASKAFYKAAEVQLLWSPTGGSLLIHTHTEVDTSGNSYYGATGLFAMGSNGKVQNVTLSKAGPIHDVKWSPLGEEFVCVFGTSPPIAALFDTNCKMTHSFGEGPHNTVSWAPHGRFLVLAGFGNMSGELSFYDRKTFSKLATVDAHMTVAYEWSPDSRFFLTGILFPRLRVDNGYRVWSCSGALLHKEEVEELTFVQWRPQPSNLFTPPDEKDLAAFKPSAASVPISKGKAYVPPSQRGAAGACGGGRSLANLADAQGVGAAPAGRSLAQLAAAVDKGGTAAMSNSGPVGAELEESKNTAKNRAKREAKKKKAEGGGEGGDVNAVEPPKLPPPAPGAAQSEVLEKKVRAIEKKLRQISELKELKAGGKTLEKNQLDKIEAEEVVRKELEDLQLKIEAETKEGMWR
ncbi:hypothetical protein AB1Y20_017683 [Prymnesium parvum]|uniref:Eukaryotic translation initiation factor 2A n=1 Tax=Prymnesium parvum TaxID=97485 RepID=A0AB34JLY2_PRYPA